MHPWSQPEESPGVFVISLDFELYWGVRDVVTLDACRDNLLGARRAVPIILDLFEEYGVHATWATVGFLFFDSKEELLRSLPEVKPRYADPALNPYSYIESIGDSEHDDPFHYGATLVREIHSSRGQELATHTFSHYYCLEDGQDIHCFEDDLRAAVGAAKRLGIDIQSLVLPRNQLNPEYLAVLENHGILSYRGTPDTWLHRGRSERHNPGYLSLLRYAESVWGNVGYNCYSLSRQSLSYPLNIPASRFLYPCYPSLLWCDALRCRRIQNELSHASKRGLLYHLWWHPHNFGAELERNIEHLRIILDHFVSLRDNGEMISMSMGELAKLLQPKAHEDTPNPDLLMSTALGGAGSWKFHPMRLDTHIHSKYSHDSLSDPMRILKVARKKRLDAISITDHGTMQAYSPGFHSSDPLVIPGMEMKTNRGDVIGLFLSEPPEGADFLEICDQIRTQGGIVVLPHPYRRSCDPIELVSHVDLIEVLNSRSRKQENARALALSHRFDAGPITGSDAHTYFEIGRAVTEVDGIYGDLDELRRVLLRADRQCFGSTSSYYVSRGFSFGAEMLKKVRR